MKNLFNPRWLIVVNTLPLIVLFLIMYSDFNIIRSLLEEESIHYWKVFGWSLAGLAIINLAYAVYLILSKKRVSAIYTTIAMIGYIAWIYLYLWNSNSIIPFSIPQWMLSGNIIVYASTFLMPTLAYCMLVLVVKLTSSADRSVAWTNFLIMVLIPVVVYVFFVVIVPLFDSVIGNVGAHIMIIGVVVCTLLFLFFLTRGLYIIILRKSKVLKKYELFWKIPIAILFPVLGLMVNTGSFMNISISNGGFFGDFTDPWFYILAVINGLVVCAPSLHNRAYRLLLFVARCFTFAFTAYFFIVFLPYLPLSVIAVIVFGLGFLMLTPTALFIIHAGEISNDLGYLRRYYSRNGLLVAGVLAFLVIPAVITGGFIRDRQVLHQALDYVYEPDYSADYQINERSLMKTLARVESQKNSNELFFTVYYMPYISSFYNWIVLDNMTLSDSKIKTMKALFTGEEYYPRQAFFEEAIGDSVVHITQAGTSSRYDMEKQAWVSEIDLELTNTDDGWRSMEYGTTFDLPDGCWISDYYLYVGDRKEPGILSEKKAALWVYSQIRDENKDPGILHYQMGNTIVFKVFPFAANEVRRTGIEFIHKEPFTLHFDGYALALGNDSAGTHRPTDIISAADGAAHYIPAAIKQNLREYTRESYFHFIIDASDSASAHKEQLIYYTDKLMRDYPALAENARISVTGAYVKTFEQGQDWKSSYLSWNPGEGFFLDRGIKTALIQAHNGHRYPVIVVVTPDMRNSVLDKSYSDFRYIYPESDAYYAVNAEGRLTTHSLVSLPLRVRDGSPDSIAVNIPVLQYTPEDGIPGYVRMDNNPSIVLRQPVFNIPTTDIKEKDWNTGLLMQSHWMSQVLHPEKTAREWVKLADMSFNSRIMTPVTSYIVVENEAQRAMIQKKQKQVLSGDASLDLSDDQPTSMSEPGFYLLLALLCAGLWVMERRRRQRV